MTLDPEEELAYASFVHTPSQAHTALYEMAKDIYGTTGILTGSRALDSIMIPTRQAWIRTWAAYSGNGKTTMLRAIALNHARRLVKEGLDDRLYVAVVVYEDSVETHEVVFEERDYTNDEFWWGKVEPGRVLRGGKSRHELPVYLIGESLAKTGLDTPAMTPRMVMAGLRAIAKKEGKLPAMVAWDYAQETTPDDPNAGSRTAQVISTMNGLDRLAKQLRCAIELGAQANKESQDNNPPVPNARQIEYSNYIFQKSANVVGLWRTWTTSSDKPTVPVAGVSYPNSPNLVVAKPLKHRPGILGKSVPFLLFPDTLEIRDVPGVGEIVF